MSGYSDLSVINAVIAPSGNLSAITAIGSQQLVGIVVPAGWLTAGLTFQVSPDGGTTFYELYDGAGNEVTLTGAASQFIQVDPTKWKGVNLLKVRSGTAASPVTQTSGATIGLVVKTVP